MIGRELGRRGVNGALRYDTPLGTVISKFNLVFSAHSLRSRSVALLRVIDAVRSLLFRSRLSRLDYGRPFSTRTPPWIDFSLGDARLQLPHGSLHYEDPHQGHSIFVGDIYLLRVSLQSGLHDESTGLVCADVRRLVFCTGLPV